MHLLINITPKEHAIRTITRIPKIMVKTNSTFSPLNMSF